MYLKFQWGFFDKICPPTELNNLATTQTKTGKLGRAKDFFSYEKKPINKKKNVKQRAETKHVGCWTFPKFALEKMRTLEAIPWVFIGFRALSELGRTTVSLSFA